MTCMYCEHRDTSVVYTSNPPMYKCEITGEFVTAQHECEIEFAPVRHGQWIWLSPMTDTMMCSECGWNIIDESFKSNFCPDCGADMRGDGE